MSHVPTTACLLVLTAVAPLPARSASDPCATFFASGQPPILINPKLDQDTYLLCNQGFAELASGITRGPIWSAEHVTAASLASARLISRQGSFHVEDSLPDTAQAQLSDYRHSGFDRGHMTPSGDMPDEASQQETFSLANMVPQTAELNRGIWERIEGAVRDLAERDGELYVVTGPAYQGGDLQSLQGRVLVPTSAWKAVYDPGMGAAGAYVCKNTEGPTCVLLPVADIARVVGVDPFPALSESVKEVVMQLPLPPDRHRNTLSRPAPREGWLQQLLEQLGIL